MVSTDEGAHNHVMHMRIEVPVDEATPPGPSIVVAALTYKRPGGLAVLLEGCARMERPEGCRVTVIIVDNDGKGSARDVVESFRSRLGDVRYVLEPRRGIPVGRNRAVTEALNLGADALCFIDDDEFPHSEWLARLVGCWRRTGADLIGGPVRVAPPPAGSTRWQRWIQRSLSSWARRKNRKTARVAAAGRRFAIYTNNWLCDLAWLRRSGVRFDEQLVVSGGSDSIFHRDAAAAGCTSAWCSEAMVYETIERERLSLRYQYHRAVSQSINHFRMRAPRVTPRIMLVTTAAAVLKGAVSLAIVCVPVFGRASPMVAVRGFGWSIGRLKGLFGRESRLYA